MRRFIVFITLILSILCVKYFYLNFGNVFYMSYALNSAKKMCEKEYNSMMQTTGYRFDAMNNIYIVDVSDINGITGQIIYSVDSGVEDKYSEQYMSVQKNIIRGRYQKLISNGCGNDTSCNVLIKDCKKGIIGSESDMNCREVYVDFGEIASVNELAKKALSAFEYIKNENFKTFIGMGKFDGRLYEFKSDKQNIPNRAEDIEKRITESKQIVLSS